jgi:hypothetical protein
MDYKQLAESVLLIKDNYYKYDKHKIREFVISQSGRNTFYQKMCAFYNIN